MSTASGRREDCKHWVTEQQRLLAETAAPTVWLQKGSRQTRSPKHACPATQHGSSCSAALPGRCAEAASVRGQVERNKISPSVQNQSPLSASQSRPSFTCQDFFPQKTAIHELEQEHDGQGCWRRRATNASKEHTGDRWLSCLAGLAIPQGLHLNPHTKDSCTSAIPPLRCQEQTRSDPRAHTHRLQFCCW